LKLKFKWNVEPRRGKLWKSVRWSEEVYYTRDIIRDTQPSFIINAAKVADNKCFSFYFPPPYYWIKSCTHKRGSENVLQSNLARSWRKKGKRKWKMHKKRPWSNFLNLLQFFIFRNFLQVFILAFLHWLNNSLRQTHSHTRTKEHEYNHHIANSLDPARYLI
jgi:hypothetical protein